MTDTPRNSMLHWYPKITTLNIPTPDTEFVGYDVVDNGFPVEWETDDVHTAVQEVGGYPAFVKADQKAWKANLKQASILHSRESIDLTLMKLIDHALSHEYPMRTIAVREHLDLNTYFEYHGLPIAPEVRFFVGEGDVLCSHFYWSDEKFNGCDRDADLADMRDVVAAHSDTLTEYAEQVAGEFDDYWSVDFAHTTDGDWYLIDMALAYGNGDDRPGSWHPESCQYATRPDITPVTTESPDHST